MVLAHQTQLSPNRLGLVAYELIIPGTIIKEEEPLVSIEIEVPFSEWSYETDRAFYESEHKHGSNMITQALSQLSRERLNLFRTLPTTRPYRITEKLDIGRFEQAAWDFPVMKADGMVMTQLVVLFSMGRVNHSCRPNAVFDHDANRGTLRAIRHIAPGEEIVVDMLPEPLWHAVQKERQRHLQTRYAYTCTCPDCNAESSEASDRMRKRMRHLRSKTSAAIAPGAQISEGKGLSIALAEAYEYLALVTAVELFDSRVVEAHEAVSKLLAQVGLRSGARDHAMHALVAAANAYGSKNIEMISPAIELLRSQS